MQSAKPHYRAFISYSHRDTQWAKWLHRSLERYVVPIDAYPPEKKLEKDGTKRLRRLTPIFRDRDELSASGSLTANIRAALESSENLIVLCSPDSAASQYVNAEIEIFRDLHPDNKKKVYALIIEGDPPECFPPAMMAGGTEPIAADAREEGDGKADAKLKLIAGILGVGFDRLKRRELRRQRNRLLTIVAVVSAVAMMTTALALWALGAERKARLAEQNSNIQEKASRARVLATTEPLTALALALDTAEEEKQLKGGLSPPVLSSLLHTLESGREIARYSSVARASAITDCSVSPDGSLIAYTAIYGAYVVDRNSGLARKVLSSPENASARRIAFHPEGELLVVGDDQGTLSVLRLDDQKVLWQHKAHDGSVKGLVWLAGSGQIVSCGGDGLLRFWTEGGKQASPDIPVPGESVGAFAISPDGKVAAVAASESSAGDGARFINCETGEVSKLETGDDLIRAFAFNQSGSRLAGAGLDRIVRFWNRKGQPLGNAIRTGHEAIVNSLAFHPFEPLVVTGSKDGTLRTYTESGEQVLAPLRGHTKAVWCVSFDKVGTNVVSAGEDGSVRVWDFPGLQAVAPIETGINCRALLFHPDGSRFAAGGMDGKLKIYAYPSGELLRTVDAHPGPCDMLVPLADGSGFASLASTANEVRVISWQGETGGEVFRDSAGRISMIAAHPQDPVLFVLGRSGELHHLSLPSLEPLQKTPFLGSNDKVVTSSGLAVIPENNCLLFRGAYSIELRQIEEPGKSLARDGGLQNSDYQKYNLAFSPDRKLVLTGGRHESGHSLFNLYRLPQLEQTGEMEAPWQHVPVAAFSHSGRELALLSDSGMLQFFSINGEAEGPELKAHKYHPRGFAVHPKDDVLATAGGGGWIRFWRYGQEAWMEAARIRLGRAKAQDPRLQSFLARTTSQILSRNPSATARGSDGKLVFPAAGISLKIPQGWVQFDPRGLALLEGLVTAMGSDEMKRVKIRGAFSKGDKVQLHLIGAPNFYLGTIDEYRGVESFAEQLPDLQAKLEGLVRGQAQTLGFATEIAFGRPAWNAGLRAFLTEGGGKGADGNLIRVKVWNIPTKSHMVAIVFSGDANLAREVEAIIETLEIDAAIAPDEEEYARAAKTLETAIAAFEQRDNRLKEMERDQAQYYVLWKKGEVEQAKGNTDEALKNYEEALVLARKWTKGRNGSPSQKPGEASTVPVNAFSLFLEIKALHRIAWLHTIYKDADRAAAAADEAIALLEKLRQPLKEQSTVEFHSMEAYCFQDMCRVLAMRKDYTAAAAWMKKSADARRKSTEADPLKEAANQIRLADALRLLSEMQRDAEDHASAIASAEEAIEVAEGIAESVRAPTWPKVVSGYYRVLAENFQAAGKGDGEITAAEASLRLAREAKNAYPDDSSYRWVIASERYCLMDALRRHAPERLEETITLLREVADEIAAIREVEGEGEVAGNDTRRVESTRRQLLTSLLLQRARELQAKGTSSDEELRLLDQAVAEAEKAASLFAGSTADTHLQEIYYHRGKFYSRQQRYAESAVDFGKRVALFRKMASSSKGEEGKRDLALALHNYASVLEKSGKVAEAKVANDEAREIMEGIVVASPDDFRAKGFLIAMEGTGIIVAGRVGDTEAVRALRARRLALADAIIESRTTEIDALIQVYYTYSGEASYRKANKIGEAEDWITLYEKALIAGAKIESVGKLTDTIRKHRDASVRSLEELRSTSAK